MKFARTALAAALVFGVVVPVAQAGADAKLNQVWSRLVDIHGELGSVESAEFSPDSQHIVTGTKFDYSVRVLRTVDGHQLWKTYVPQEIERVAWTMDGKSVAAVSEDGLMRVFDAMTGKETARHQHENGIDGLAASPDGRFMVSGQERVGAFGVIRVFDTTNWKVARTIQHPGTVNEIDFSSDGKLLAAVGDRFARVYSTSDWSVFREWTLPKAPDEIPQPGYINTKFHPDNKVLAVGGEHGNVYLYNVESGKRIRTLNKTGQKTETVAWSGDGSHLLVAGHGHMINAYHISFLLDLKTDNDSIPYAFQTPVSDALEYMDFNAEGTLLTTAHQDGTVQLWTYMSDDPNINSRRHEEVKQRQKKAAAESGLKREGSR